MGQAEDGAAERTYWSIGRFMFEFSQVEYTIRHYLPNEIEHKEKFFAPVVGSYEVMCSDNRVMCAVAEAQRLLLAAVSITLPPA